MRTEDKKKSMMQKAEGRAFQAEGSLPESAEDGDSHSVPEAQEKDRAGLQSALECSG